MVYPTRRKYLQGEKSCCAWLITAILTEDPVEDIQRSSRRFSYSSTEKLSGSRVDYVCFNATCTGGLCNVSPSTNDRTAKENSEIQFTCPHIVT